MRPLTILSTVLLAAMVLGVEPVWGEQPILIIDSGGHTARIQDVIFTRDAEHVVSAGNDKVVRVWEVATGQVVRTIRGEIGPGPFGKIYAAALSPDDRVLAVGGLLAGKKQQLFAARLHDFRSGEVQALLKGHDYPIYSLAFSPDSRILASASQDQTVRLWKVASEKRHRVLRGHKAGVYTVAFSPDGERLASGGMDGTVFLWDVPSGKLISVLGHGRDVFAVAFSPDGRFLASGGSDQTVRLWDAHTGEYVQTLASLENVVASLAFHPDSKKLLTSATGRIAPFASRVFAVPSGDEVSSYEHKGIVVATTFAPDGRFVATGDSLANEILLWRPENGELVHRLAGRGRPVWSVAFARNGRSLAFGQTSSPDTIQDRRPLERTLLFAPDDGLDLTLGDSVSDEADYVRSRHKVAGYRLETPSGGSDRILHVVRGGKTLSRIERLRTQGSGHRSFTLNSDGRQVVSGSSDGFLTVYDANGSWIHDLEGHTGDVWAVAVSNDDRWVASGSDDQTVRLWDLATGRLLVSFFADDDGEWVAWTPRGYYTASYGGDRYVGWHVNRGVDRQADYFPVHQFRREYYRPDVVAKTLELRDHDLALREADRFIHKPSVAEPLELPPKVIVLSPEDGLTVTEQVLRVDALAVSDERPITALTVTLNDRTVAGRLEGKTSGNARLRRREVLDVDLEPGLNVLAFVAATDVAQSQRVELRVVYQPKPGTEQKSVRSKLAVLAVGIAHYHEPALRLDYADDDARAIAEVFDAQDGRIYDVETRVLDGRDPVDREAVIGGLTWLQKAAPDSGDVRLLFLSGHGGLDAGGDYYFFAQDHDRDVDPELYDLSWLTLLKRLTQGHAMAVMMVDTCHAAAATGQRLPQAADFTRVLKQIHSQAPGLVTFAASTGRQESIEHDKWGHGAFTKAVLEGLGEGKADGHGGPLDGVVEVKELGAWLRDRVVELTDGRQTPETDAVGLDALPLFRTREE